MWRSEGDLRVSVLSFCHWVSGTELGSSGLAASTFAHCAISKAQSAGFVFFLTRLHGLFRSCLLTPTFWDALLRQDQWPCYQLLAVSIKGHENTVVTHELCVTLRSGHRDDACRTESRQLHRAGRGGSGAAPALAEDAGKMPGLGRLHAIRSNHSGESGN